MTTLRKVKVASASLLMLGLSLFAINALFGFPNRRAPDGGDAVSLERLYKGAAGNAHLDDVGEVIKHLDPANLQVLLEVLEDPRLKDPRLQEMFSHGFLEERFGDADSLERLFKVASGNADLDDLGQFMKHVDPANLQVLFTEALKDPQLQEMDPDGYIKELMKMDITQFQAEMEGAMNIVHDMQQNIMTHKGEVLDMIEAQGYATAEDIAEYRADPKKFEEAMSEDIVRMNGFFSNPKNVKELTQMMKGVGARNQDPAAGTSKLGGVLKHPLSDDMLEEVRLRFLNGLSVTDNDNLSDMFGRKEVKEILNDPVKWRAMVEESQKISMEEEENEILGMGEL